MTPLPETQTPRPCCSIGAREDAPAIDEDIRRGDGLGTLAKRYRLSKPTLGRHRRGCLGIREAAAAPLGTPVSTNGDTPGDTPDLAVDTPVGTVDTPPLSPRPIAGPNPGDDPLTSPRKIVTATLEAQVVDLRVKGKTYEQIAQALEINEDTAMDMVERVLIRTRGKADAKVEQARALEVRRCDAVIAAFWDRATDPTMAEVQVPGDGPGGLKKYDGQDKAADRLLKAMERRAKLLGLDTPTGPAVQLTLVNAPGFQELVTTILSALAAHPEALADVKVAIRVALGGRRPEPLLIEASPS